MEGEVKFAVEAEKSFNNCNQLLMTLVDDQILIDKIKSVHKSIKNVNVLQPRFVPQTRYIIEVTNVFDVHSVMNTLMEHNFEGRDVHIRLLDNNGYLDLDPYKLEVKNLPSNISTRDLKQLFPLSTGYTFSATCIKPVIVHFENVQDAISSFKTTHLTKYKDNVLSIKFVRKNSTGNGSPVGDTNRRAKMRSKRDHFANKRIKTEGNEEFNTAQQRTDTLIVHNLPLNMKEKDILNLFPNLNRYKYLQKTLSKSCIIRFKTTSEALIAYINCVDIYKSRILQIEFYDKDLDKSECRSFKATKFDRDRRNQHPNGNNSPNRDNYFPIEQEIKKELDHHSENRRNSLTLCVENLPINITKEDIRQLFPKHNTHQLHLDKTKDCASAFVCFFTHTAASNAYKSMQNKEFGGHVLSVNFKSKRLKVNPFAAKIARNSVDSKSGILNSSNSQNDIRPPRISTHVLRDINGELVAEDDVECQSEDNYSEEDDYEVSNVLEDDDTSSDEESPRKDFTESILPSDEDFF